MSARVLPDVLSDQFVVTDRLDFESNEGNELYLLSPRNPLDSTKYLLKCSPAARTNYAAFQTIGRIKSENLNSPLQLHRLGNTYFQLYEYIGSTTFHDHIVSSSSTSVSLESVESFIRQLSSAISALHTAEENSIIHCDIKPSNILIRPGSKGALNEFILADFDCAIAVHGGNAHRTSRYTPEYAAPEIVAEGAMISSAADYWSLGVVIHEWVTHRNPLAGLDKSTICARLIAYGHEYFDLSPIENTKVRSLLGGLLQSDPVIRWQQEQIARWLDNDPDIIREGLRLGGATCARQSFQFANISIQTLAEVGQALLRVPPQSAELLASLADWINQEFPEAQDLAAEVRELHGTEGSSGIAILKAAYRCWPSMPPIWRQVVINETNLISMCRIAMDDSETAAVRTHNLEWLQSVSSIDGPLGFFTALTGYENQRVADATRLLRKLLEVRDEYSRSWSQILNAAGEELAGHAIPEVHAYLPRLFYSTLDSTTREILRDENRNLFSPELILFRRNWFYVFGTHHDLSVAQIMVLEELEQVSRIGELITIRNSDDLNEMSLEGLSGRIIQLQTQMFEDLMPSPGAEILHLRPGESFSEFPSESTTQLLATAFLRSVRESWQHLRGIRATNGSPTQQPTNSIGGDQSFDVFLIRMSAKSELFSSDDLRNIYLIRMSWRGLIGRSIRISIKKPLWFFRSRLLEYRRLPISGHMVAFITQKCVIECREKVGVFTLHRHAPVVINLGESAIQPCISNESLQGLNGRVNSVLDNSQIGHFEVGILSPGAVREVFEERIEAPRLIKSTNKKVTAVGEPEVSSQSVSEVEWNRSWKLILKRWSLRLSRAIEKLEIKFSRIRS